MKRFGPLGWLVQTDIQTDRHTQTLWEPVECREVSRTVETFRPVRMVGTDRQTDKQTYRQIDRQTHADTVGASRV